MKRCVRAGATTALTTVNDELQRRMEELSVSNDDLINLLGAVEGPVLMVGMDLRQVELEIQNRALREAQEQLEQSRERYLELYDFAPVAYLTLEGDGSILEANIAAGRLIGQDRALLLGRRIQTLVAMTDPHAFRTALRRALEEMQDSRTELSFRTVHQSVLTVEMLVSPALGTGPGHTGAGGDGGRERARRGRAERPLPEPGRCTAQPDQALRGAAPRRDRLRRSLGSGRGLLGRARWSRQRGLALRSAPPEDDQRSGGRAAPPAPPVRSSGSSRPAWPSPAGGPRSWRSVRSGR